MFHLDNNSGVLVMPNLSVAQSNEPKWFTEGDTKVAASYPGQDWFNMVQAELLNILVEAGIKSNKTELNQLATAIKKIINAKITAATTLEAGIVKLGSDVDKDDETIAATLKAVKKAYDLADGALPKGAGGIGLATQISTNDIDIDTYAFNVGFYSGNNWSCTKGLPFGSTASDVWFYLINQNLASSGSDYKLQILGLNETGTPRLAMRYKVKGAWTDWAEYVTESNISNLFENQLTDSGYQKLPNGLIIQWGYNISPNGYTSLPITFPNKGLSLVVSNTDRQGDSVDNAFGYLANNSTIYMAFKGYGQITQGFKASYIALGY